MRNDEGERNGLRAIILRRGGNRSGKPDGELLSGVAARPHFRKVDEAKKLVAVVTNEAEEDVVLASATLPEPAAAPSTPLVEETELALRDANVATELIATHFPVQTWTLRYCGVLSDVDSDRRTRTGFRRPPERCWWVLKRGDSSVTFELLTTQESERDVPLHVDIDRTVFIHVIRCRDDADRSIPVDEYKVADVEILELFRRCDERAVEHWEREGIFWALLNEIDQPETSLYALEANRLWRDGGPATPAQRPQYPPEPAARFDVWPISMDGELDAKLSRFVGQPLNQMISELSMTRQPNAPFVSFSNTRGGRWFWNSPEYPDHFIEIYFDGPYDNQVVRGIALRDREPRQSHSPTPVNPQSAGAENGVTP